MPSPPSVDRVDWATKELLLRELALKDPARAQQLKQHQVVEGPPRVSVIEAIQEEEERAST